MTIAEPYSMFPNRITDSALSGDFSKNEIKIIFFILRHTYGFHSEIQPLSETFIAKGTGICKRWVHDTVKSLLEKRVIVETRAPTTTQPRELGISPSFGLLKNSPDDEIVTGGTDETVTGGTDEIVTRGTDETVTQEKKYINKNINKYNNPHFEKPSTFDGGLSPEEYWAAALERRKERQ